MKSLGPSAPSPTGVLPGPRGAFPAAACLAAVVALGIEAAPAVAVPRFAAPSVPHPIGANSNSLVVADLNGDGWPDLVTAGGNSGVEILLGTGAGTFAPYREVATPAGLERVTAADLDGDGLPDLIVTSVYPATITVLLSRGDDFERSELVVGESGNGVITVGDMNEDGHPDLVGSFSGRVAVWPGRGDGTFAPRIESEVGSQHGTMPLGDLNGDGHLDLVLIAPCGVHMVVPGAGDGTFLPAIEPVCGEYGDWYSSPVLADLNRDGRLDLVTTWHGEAFRDERPGGVRTFLGSGDGTFTGGGGGGAAWNEGPGSVTVADVNGDLNPDLISTWEYGGRVLVALGRGEGTFEGTRVAGYGALVAAVADLDGDGRTDLATVGSGGAVSVSSGNGDGTFGRGRTSPFGAPSMTVSGDLNGDGLADLAIARAGCPDTQDAGVSVALADGAGGFTPGGHFDAGQDTRQIAIGELNGDGRPDLAVTNSDFGELSILLAEAGGGFAARRVVPLGGYPRGIAITDLDRDGHGDLVVLEYVGIATLRGNGDGTFAPRADHEAGTRFTALMVEDLDRDGVPDLVLGVEATGAVAVMRGDGSGGFGPRVDHPVGHVPLALAAGDLDGDGRPDLVSGGWGAAAALLGRGDGTFAPAGTTALAGAANSAAVADLDDDGAPDLALLADGAITVLPGQGDGTFGAPVRFGTGGYAPNWVGSGEWNGDGRPDLAVTNGGWAVWTYPENCNYRGGTAVTLFNDGPAPVQPAPVGPVPVFGNLPAGQPASIVLGESFTVTVRVRNDGLASDDGRIAVSFPSFAGAGDGEWVSGTTGGDLPGYRETAAGGVLAGADCLPVAASYLVAEYVDGDWLAGETNAMTLTVTPQAVGTFHFYVRSSMHAAGGGCVWASGLPLNGEGGLTDQQGRAVKRFSVTVAPPPLMAEPVFVAPVAVSAGTITIGEEFSLALVVRNDGARSDDGRVVVGFPSLTNGADGQWVAGASAGDAPGYREISAGGPLADARCRPLVASYLTVEYADDDWAGFGAESDTLVLTVRPPAVGDFHFDVRSTMRGAGGGACRYVNAVPAGGDSVPADPQGWPVRRFTVSVLPLPPAPLFVGDVTLDPPAALTLGGTLTVTATVANAGRGTDDGRIVISFPGLYAPSDTQWVSAAGGDDAPGTREYPVGATIPRADCSPMTAGYVVVEYADDAWAGEGAETNQLVVHVRPTRTGTFLIHVRSTMRWEGGGPCRFVNGVPANGSSGRDEPGWVTRVVGVQVVAPPPPPVFVGAVTGIPAAITLGENFRITATVQNGGPASADGRIHVGFPTLTRAADAGWVSDEGGGGGSGVRIHPPGTTLLDSGCRGVTAGYVVVERADSAWATGEVNVLSVLVQPTTTDTFHVDVRATLRDDGVGSGGCGFANGIPAGGGIVRTDPQGWPVRRYSVAVRAPAELPRPTTAWERMLPPPGGPGARAGATAVYRSARGSLVIYGGSDPLYRDDVWALPLDPGGAWSRITPGGPTPIRRIMHSMVYNEPDDQVVVFGGHYNDFLDDLTVLTLTGQPWWFPDPGQGTPPSPRGGHVAVYDPVRRRMLVIGGYGQTLMNDVWEYAPAAAGTWRPLSPAGTPMPARAQHAAVYDPVRDRVIVIGGDGGGFLDDVWALELAGGPRWERLAPAGTPPGGRREHTAIYDPVGDRVIVYGGFDGRRRGDVWSLDLAGAPAWRLLASSTMSPAGRQGHVAVYDAANQRMVVYGGVVGPDQFGADLWALQLDVTTPVVVALAASEATPDRVRLEWAAERAGELDAVVSRSAAAGAWVEIGRPRVENGDRLVFEDRDVVPGARYGYRLALREGAAESSLEPLWVTVPFRPTLSLGGAFPNPSPGAVSVRLSLPGDHDATLELFDLRGRRLAAREVGSLGAGEHVVPLSDRGDLPAGVYLVRLTHDRRVLTAKACVVK